MDDPKDARYSRNLFVAFAAVVVAFIVVTVYANWRTLEIEQQTRDVAMDALPSVEHLVAVKDGLRRIEAASARYPDLAADQRRTARAAIEGTWNTIDQELAAYVALPAFEGERALYGELPPRLRAVDESLRQMFDQVDARDPVAARATTDGGVAEGTARAVAALNDLVDLNMSHAYDGARRIDHLRQRAAMAAFVLDAVAVLVAVGAVVWVLRLFRVHTHLLRHHNELVEQRATELEAFGTRVAHDLLSPLSALTYCLSAFKRAGEADPSLQEASARARACVRRAQTMVDGIFEFSRAGGKPQAGASTPVREAIDQVVEEVCSSEARERPDVEVQSFPDCAVACSRGVLVSVVTNLMRNAAKFMSDSAVRKITVRVEPGEKDVRVEVEDTGPGVAAHLRDAIFEPYVRAEGATQPGLGLGLATVKRLCLAHGGSVGVRSVVGRGAVFWVTLPLATADAAELPPAESTKLRRVS